MQTRMHPVENFNVEMLILARELRQLSQSELAARLGVSQGRISKIENRLLPVDGELLPKLSSELDVPESFFFQPAPVYGLPISYFRKRSSVTQRELASVIAELNVRRIHVTGMLKSVEIECEREIPDFDPDRFGDAVSVARAVRAAWHLPDAPVKSLVGLVESAGCIVVPCQFGHKIDAISQWVPGGVPMIFVNRTKPMDRLRFSIAHELGHLVMHRKVPNDDMEKEADAFAAEFLMPEAGIKTQLPRSLSLASLAALKPIWGVSMAALLFRAKALGRITDRQYSYLWMQMGQAGYRSREPAELDVPWEEPQTLKAMIEAHTERLGYSEKDLLEMLCVNASEYQSWYGLPAQRGHLRLVK